jgi:hypothetical protein
MWLLSQVTFGCENTLKQTFVLRYEDVTIIVSPRNLAIKMLHFLLRLDVR